MKIMVLNKNNLKLLSGFVFFCLLVACNNNIILEKKDVYNFKVEEKKDKLIISGLCGHSAYKINEIEVVKKAKSLSVLIYISTITGVSGSFKKEVLLTKDIEKVFFGKYKANIWIKNSISKAQ